MRVLGLFVACMGSVVLHIRILFVFATWMNSPGKVSLRRKEDGHDVSCPLYVDGEVNSPLQDKRSPP